MAHILIAEDDPSMRQFLTLALERAGHRVAAHEDGLSALSALERGAAASDPHDLLLADIVMPGMDGIELSQKAMALIPGLKVMFVTGFAAVIAGAESVGNDVMTKPFHLNDLVSRVETLLAA